MTTRHHPEILSLTAAGESLGLSDRTKRRYIADGKLPAFRVADTRTIRVYASDVAALLTPIPTVRDWAQTSEGDNRFRAG